MQTKIYVREHSIVTGITYLAQIPEHCFLLPPSDSEGQTELTLEEFNKLLKERIGIIFLLGEKCVLFKERTKHKSEDDFNVHSQD